MPSSGDFSRRPWHTHWRESALEEIIYIRARSDVIFLCEGLQNDKTITIYIYIYIYVYIYIYINYSFYHTHLSFWYQIPRGYEALTYDIIEHTLESNTFPGATEHRIMDRVRTHSYLQIGKSCGLRKISQPHYMKRSSCRLFIHYQLSYDSKFCWYISTDKGELLKKCRWMTW